MASPNNSLVPPLASVVDGSGVEWTIAQDGSILLDGVNTGGGHGSIILWWNGSIYVFGTDGNWYLWHVDSQSYSNFGATKPGPPKVWHSVTVIPQTSPFVPAPVDGFIEAEDDIAVAIALNFIEVNGGTVVAVLASSGLVAVTDETGNGHYHWVRIIYTTVT